jgi:hypothetical protein
MKAAPGRRSVMATVEAVRAPQTTCQIVARRLVASGPKTKNPSRGLGLVGDRSIAFA